MFSGRRARPRLVAAIYKLQSVNIAWKSKFRSAMTKWDYANPNDPWMTVQQRKIIASNDHSSSSRASAAAMFGLSKGKAKPAEKKGPPASMYDGAAKEEANPHLVCTEAWNASCSRGPASAAEEEDRSRGGARRQEGDWDLEVLQVRRLFRQCSPRPRSSLDHNVVVQYFTTIWRLFSTCTSTFLDGHDTVSMYMELALLYCS